MISIGITGGIGSGKSVVTRILSSMGIPCYIADDAAKSLYDTDPVLQQDMVQIFGENIFPNGNLDKAALAKLVFQDKDKLQALNALVHPAVGRDFLAWKSRQNSHIVAFESALLFRSSTGLQFDKTICVSAPEALRIERVCARNQIKPQEVKARIQHQMPQDEMEKRSDFVIINDDIRAILPQIQTILKQL